MPDDNSMTEKILRTIEGYIDSDPNLKEFSIVPTGDQNLKNKSPVLHEENNLGLESWCVKFIYKYAYAELMRAQKMSRFKKCKRENVNHLLIGALLINPDVYTFWNMKRDLVLQDVLDINKELTFTKLVLSYKSKSNEAFAYRKWLIMRLLHKANADDINFREILLEREFDVTEMAAAKAENNYHAWSHRIWIVNLVGNSYEMCYRFLENELEYSFQFVYSHVSQHSGYHYRQVILNLISKFSNDRTSYEKYYKDVRIHVKLIENNMNYVLVLRELLGSWDTIMEMCCDVNVVNRTVCYVNYFSLMLYELFFTLGALFKSFPGHEAMWVYRRSIIYHIFQAAYDCLGITWNRNVKLNHMVSIDGRLGNGGFFENIIAGDNGEKQPKLFKYQSNLVESSLLYRILLRHERTFIDKALISTSAPTCKLTIEYAKRYEWYLKHVLEMYEL